MTEVYDIAIIGGGPAGLSAAVTARIRNKSTILFEHGPFSAKLRKAPHVDNYLGIADVNGEELMSRFVAHCKKLDPVIVEAKVTNIYPDTTFTILTPTEAYQARSVIIATGVVNTAIFPGERDFLGRGVSYCATCDGMLYREKPVAVVSYTREGEHEANFLAEICKDVYYFPQYPGALDGLHEKVQVRREKPVGIDGESVVRSLKLKDSDVTVDGIFVLRHSDPVENIISGLEMEGEVIKVDRCLRTNIPGLFAAGDCTGKPWQVSKAVGEGLVAAIHAVEFLDNLPSACQR